VAHQSAVEYGACRKAGSGAARLRQHQLKVDKRENIKKRKLKIFFLLTGSSRARAESGILLQETTARSR
jgi:hypothetical protein